MELYLDKEFLNKFNSEVSSGSNSKGKVVLGSVLKTYGNINLYTDYDLGTVEKLQNFNNIFFSLFPQNFPPLPISSIDSHFFENSKCEQTMIFTLNQEDWFGDAEKKGALCFSYDNFDFEIERIMSVCENIKVDLSEPFIGWQFFNQLKTIPKSKIIINDGYLFVENSGNKPLDQNLIPLLKNITATQSDIKVDFFTNYLNSTKPRDAIDIEKIKRKLSNVFKSDYKLAFEYIQYHSHDRILYSNFFIIECGVGFNFNATRPSNSKITVDTIFEKFNYTRMNNHLRNLELKKRTSTVQL